MWDPDEDDNADRGGVLGETHTYVRMEKRFPFIRRREEDGYKRGTDGADHGIEKGGEG